MNLLPVVSDDVYWTFAPLDDHVLSKILNTLEVGFSRARSSTLNYCPYYWQLITV